MVMDLHLSISICLSAGWNELNQGREPIVGAFYGDLQFAFLLELGFSKER